MKPRYRLILRRGRGAMYYCVDTQTNKRTSLETSDRHQAKRLLYAKNEAALQPMLNLQIALFATDATITTRTWRDAIVALT